MECPHCYVIITKSLAHEVAESKVFKSNKAEHFEFACTVCNKKYSVYYYNVVNHWPAKKVAKDEEVHNK